MRKDAFSYGTETVLIRTDSNTITFHYGFFIRSCYFDNYQSLAADLPGPVNNRRKGTDITDKIRIVTDRTDKYGSPIRSVRSVRNC